MGSVVGQRQEDREGPGDGRAVVLGQRGQPVGEHARAGGPCVLARAGPGLGRADQRAAAVGGVRSAVDQAEVDERLHGRTHRLWADALGSGEVGDRALAVAEQPTERCGLRCGDLVGLARQERATDAPVQGQQVVGEREVRFHTGTLRLSRPTCKVAFRT
ncbi:hypothetical protein Cus16_2877 [Curtobacterium sp. ER1/6]|nr:hypothetical protein Cus16_2877 [Curtobacterium sp. ER1/6]